MLNHTIDQAISKDKKPFESNYINSEKATHCFLTYSYPYSLKYPFDIIYLPGSCEAISQSIPFYYPVIN